MLRGKPETLIAEVAFCVRMGWTQEQLYESDARFVELIEIYLNTEANILQRDKEDFEREMEALKHGGR